MRSWPKRAGTSSRRLAHLHRAGRVYAAHTGEGRIVATTATLPYGDRFAWISMVLVKGEYRRHGLATQLMRRAMDELAREGRIPILDATPDGRAVYRRLGFEDSWGFATAAPPRAATRGTATLVGPAGITIRAIVDQDWPALCAYDAAAFGADRSAVLAGLRGRLAGRPSSSPSARAASSASRSAATACSPRHRPVDCGRRGHRGRAPRARARGARRSAVRRSRRQQAGAAQLSRMRAASTPVRPFTRMLYGSSTRFDDPARTFAVVGPEFG